MGADNVKDENEERAYILMIEQLEIIEQADSIWEKLRGLGRKWNRFRGNTICNIVARHLEKHLPNDVKLVKLAWVDGCPTEFDVLVVDKDAMPVDFTDAYRKEEVRLLMEIKSSGLYYKREDIKNNMSKMFETWKIETGKPILYLTIWEAKAHIKEVQDAIGNDTAFALRVEGEDMQIGVIGEWERFLDRVEALLGPHGA